MRANPELARPAGRLGRPGSAQLARLLGVVGIALVLAELPLSAFAHQLDASNALFVLVISPFGAVGCIVAQRQPRNPIGWILLATALTFLAAFDAGFYGVRAFRLGDPGLPLARVAVFVAAWWVGLIILLPLPIALFPDGRIAERGWRLLFRIHLVFCAVLAASILEQDLTGISAARISVDSTGELAVFGSSTTTGWTKAAHFLIVPLFVGFSLAWVGRQLAAYRHAVAVQRQQVKCLLGGGALTAAGLALGTMFSHAREPALQLLAIVGWALVGALPVGIGVGILRYRLYEIDRLISRTLSYTILTGLLATVFVGVIFVATDVLPFSSPVAVAASTLAAAALFNPLRRHIQRLVDRRFNRDPYDAQAIVSALSQRLREAVDLDTVRQELVSAVDQAVQPAHASVWIRPSTRSPR